MFVHRSGKVTCSKNDCSYWGCVLDANVIGVLLTDGNKYWLQKQLQVRINANPLEVGCEEGGGGGGGGLKVE